mmetsp:Transcript_14767/g.36944  ORF Transcript_14767/g.36944 Transcript_14767/m.36944 type:complete len:102 (-) Transcript_14767:185-490(-)|eukprot:CAMPEP_0173434556 /NCGR_PEP_ID=MMETSP1357-20121228/13114_1 /TAXON_ID=77926 /ORGANISM="Hemiselmis rufescens, Strain PCC563" /LENGTH=101 /DNA_ID=CAMNT_0014399433 /DNA_START=24 /DNA_END=329 /DNA_ORIENTATION=-
MANNLMIDELKAALNSAQPHQLNSHSTLKAAEALLKCLRRDGVMAGEGIGGAPAFNYGMNYVDGASGNPQISTAGMSKAQKVEVGRHTEGAMKGSSWSSHY